MIDGVKLACTGVAAADWLACPLLDFGTLISERTGEVLSNTKEAERNGLRFRVGKQVTGGGFCSLLGSLHRYKNKGNHNADHFTYSDLQNVIDNLASSYSIDPAATYIQRAEIGVNIPLNYSPDILIKSAICYKGKAFGTLRSGRRILGKIIEFQNYNFKLYNKGKQSGTGGNVLRIEVTIKRNSVLKPYGVRTLADLTDPAKCFSLLGLLLDKIKNTIFYDFSYKGGELTEKQYLRYEQYSNPNYWENLDRYNLAKAKLLYWDKVAKYGAINWQKWAIKTALKTWQNLFDFSTEKSLNFTRNFHEMQADEISTFYVFNCFSYFVENCPAICHKIRSEKTAPKTPAKTTTKQPKKNHCFCLSCGRDISDQKTGSRFCSEKIHGKAARTCRNKDSNARLAKKRKLKRAIKANLWVKITYNDHNETRRAQNITLARDWLDSVMNLEPIKKIKSNEPRKNTKQKKKLQPPHNRAGKGYPRRSDAVLRTRKPKQII